MKKNFFLPENVIDLFGQRSVGFMTVNLGGFASNVHFAFGLFDLIFFEGIFQLCHFTSNICKSRREKMCKQMYTSKLNKFDQLIGKTNMGVSLHEEKSFVNRLWAESMNHIINAPSKNFLLKHLLPIPQFTFQFFVTTNDLYMIWPYF